MRTEGRGKDNENTCHMVKRSLANLPEAGMVLNDQALGKVPTSLTLEASTGNISRRGFRAQFTNFTPRELSNLFQVTGHF